MPEFQPKAYWERRLAENFHEGGVGDICLPQSYNRHLYAVRRQRFRDVVRHLPTVPHSAHVLDIGSGTGAYIEAWQEWGATGIVGSDLTDHSVARLGARYPGCTFRQLDIGDAAAAHWAPGRFDVVSAFDVLFHIVDDDRYARALQNVAAMLKPKGWFLFSDNLVRVSRRTTHFVTRSEGTVLEAIDRAGFDVVVRVPMFVFMNDPVRCQRGWRRSLYSRVYRLACHGEVMGGLIGGLLRPIEVLATRLTRSGPSTEILLCRRRD